MGTKRNDDIHPGPSHQSQKEFSIDRLLQTFLFDQFNKMHTLNLVAILHSKLRLLYRY